MRPSLLSGSLRETSRVVGRPSQMYGSGRESLLDVQEWLVDPPGCPGVVGSPYRMSGSGREALLDVWECSGGLTGFREAYTDIREGLPTSSGHAGGPPDHS